MKPYHESLSNDYYYYNYYSLIRDRLIKCENTLFSSIVGCGGNTFFYYFIYKIENESFFSNLTILDFELSSSTEILRAIKKTANNKNSLIIIKNLHLSLEPQSFLEKVLSINNIKINNNVLFSTANYTGITKANLYTAKNSFFFSYRFNLLPLTKENTLQVADSMGNYYGWKIEEIQREKLYDITGGIPRFIKHIIENVAVSGVQIDDFNQLEKDPSISYQLNYISQLLINEPRDNLLLLKLVNEKGEIKSKLASHYFADYCDRLIATIYPYLTVLEIKLLTYLYLNINQLVTLDKIGDLMLMGNNNYSQWAIYKQISRLKPKIKDRFILQNIKGRGYILREAKDV